MAAGATPQILATAPARAAAAPLPRLAFLDQIRALLTLLVVLHHAAITYGGAGGSTNAQHQASQQIQHALARVW
jgi:hypothetical protein